MTVLPVTDTTFEEEVLRSELPVLVDFYADWCAPCKQLSPVVEEIAAELDGKLKVVKVDVDKNPNVAAAFQVKSIPTLFLVKDGKVVGGQPGVLPKAAILQMVKPLLPVSSSELEPKDLAKLLLEQRAVPVDIRDASSFGRTRIPGAIHLPEDELEARAEELRSTDGRVFVLYERSTDGAKDAAEALTKKGVSVAFLVGGFLHWEADGLDIERPS